MELKEEKIKKAFFWITGILEELEVPYQLTGGFAAKAYGSPRDLADIDIEVSEENVKKVADRVKEYINFGPEKYLDLSWDLTVATFTYEGQEIDIASVDALIFDQKSKEWGPIGSDLSLSNQKEIFGKVVPVIPLASLIEYKSKLLRDVDRQDLDYFNSIKQN